MATAKGDITLLLQRWQGGDKDAESKIFELLLPELRKIAARCFRQERQGNSLQPTLLVNEAYIRLVTAKHIDWQDRGHFLAMSGRMMRRFLIERFRTRPDVQFLPLEGLPERVIGQRTPVELIVEFDKLLAELEKESTELCAVVELKFFLGKPDLEAAEFLHLNPRTLQRQWSEARYWLFERLSGKSCKPLFKTTSV